jgi:hypothetical protein
MGARTGGKSPGVTLTAAVVILAGIVARGLGIIAIIFGLGMLVGIVLALSVLRALRRH